MGSKLVVNDQKRNLVIIADSLVEILTLYVAAVEKENSIPVITGKAGKNKASNIIMLSYKSMVSNIWNIVYSYDNLTSKGYYRVGEGLEKGSQNYYGGGATLL